MDLRIFYEVFLSGPILFFLLGFLAILIRSDMKISKEITNFLSLYVLSAIGIKGGHAFISADVTSISFLYLLIGVMGSIVISWIGFKIFNLFLTRPNAAAFAATYGSISAMTFVTGISVLDRLSISYGPYMIACMALMEAPAIIVAVALFRSHARSKSQSLSVTIHHAITNHSVILLLGAFVIGLCIPNHAWEQVQPFYNGIFYGMLGLFLLDLGLVSARCLPQLLKAPKRIFIVSLIFSFSCAWLACGIMYLIGASKGDAFLMMLLFGSGSYIAVPAALKTAIPKADIGLYLPMALGVTFPLNILFGIPFYLWAVELIFS